jgi:hypothetical protein
LEDNRSQRELLSKDHPDNLDKQGRNVGLGQSGEAQACMMKINQIPREERLNLRSMVTGEMKSEVFNLMKNAKQATAAKQARN